MALIKGKCIIFCYNINFSIFYEVKFNPFFQNYLNIKIYFKKIILIISEFLNNFFYKSNKKQVFLNNIYIFKDN